LSNRVDLHRGSGFGWSSGQETFTLQDL
jgi:hypothetical protein